MDAITEITRLLIDFRDARNWQQFHNPKDLALALSIEAAELNELFLWKTREQHSQIDRTRIAEELADVLAYAFMIAEKYQFDIPAIMGEKIAKNALKYPVEKSRNLALKYTELEEEEVSGEDAMM
ncbi:MAG: nucleotide pyrophosphohydrolase [Bacteroidales bacterium]|nr:nucleotide pyrophosphohydrolase [Bacteroidales bacterium]